MPTQQDPASILNRADFHSGDIVFLFRVSARKFSGLDTQFVSEPSPGKVSDPKLTPFPTHPGVKYVARSPLLLMKAKKA